MRTRLVINSKSDGKVRRENRDGRDVIIVSSATMPGNIVMNDVFYPADEIASTYMQLNSTPAPVGHPTRDRLLLSARHPEGMVRGFIGAWNENARLEGGRVHLDKVIDVQFASQLEDGRRVLAAIEKGVPIHTSTGVYAKLSPLTNHASGAKYIARTFHFDHDAILLDGPGAATPEQGVGMLVNALADDGEEVAVVYGDVDQASPEYLTNINGDEKLLAKVKAAVIAAFTGSTAETKNKECKMAVTDEQFAALLANVAETGKQIAALTAGIPAVVAEAVKPVAEAVAAMQANELAKVNAEVAAERALLANVNLMSGETLAGLPAATVKDMVATLKLSTTAAPLLPGGNLLTNGEGQKSLADMYKLPGAAGKGA